MAKGFVVASRDFGYDDGTVGAVKMGQVFQLQGHPNDHKLLKHKHLSLLEPQPKDLTDLPQCPECGRRFTYPVHRERCAESHSKTPAELLQARREASAERAAAGG